MIKLTTPFVQSELDKLNAGDVVYITGSFYTGRDAAHKRLVNLIENGKELPINIENEGIYYVGPTPTKPGHVVGSCGPTSSYRMDDYTEPLLKKGLKVMIGKGGRAYYIVDLCKKYKAIYFCAIGGAAAKLAKCVTKSEDICYEDLGAEAIRKFTVEDFPVIVGFDTKGGRIL